MPDLIELEIATPERLVVRENVSDVQVPGQDGYLGILPGHAPLLGLLGVGLLSYPQGGVRRYIALRDGFLEVQPDHVRVLATSAERAEEIDVERARAALKKALDEALNPNIGIDPAAAWYAILHEQARVEAAEKK
jgi:F-type H+-transporting ATPase subunit epsilon